MSRTFLGWTRWQWLQCLLGGIFGGLILRVFGEAVAISSIFGFMWAIDVRNTP